MFNVPEIDVSASREAQSADSVSAKLLAATDDRALIKVADAGNTELQALEIKSDSSTLDDGQKSAIEVMNLVKDAFAYKDGRQLSQHLNDLGNDGRIKFMNGFEGLITSPPGTEIPNIELNIEFNIDRSQTEGDYINGINFKSGGREYRWLAPPRPEKSQ